MRYGLILFLSLFFSNGLFAQKKSNYDIADSLLDLGRYKEALPFYDKALSEDARHEKAYRGRGYSFFMMHEYAKARADYNKALEINPDCSRCYINLALITANENPEKIKDVLVLADKAVALDQKDARLYIERGSLRETTGDKNGAFMDYNNAVRLEPDNPDILLERARYQLRSGYDALALGDLNKILEKHPDYSGALYERAVICINRQVYEQALDDITKGISLDSLNTSFHYAHAYILAQTGKSAEAKTTYDWLVDRDPDNADFYYGRAGVVYKLEDMDGACRDYKKAYELLTASNPSSQFIPVIKLHIDDACDESKMSYYYHRGIAQYNLGQFEKAITFYDQALTRFPGSPMLLSFKGNALLKLGKYPEAIEAYSSAISVKEKIETEARSNPRFANASADSIDLYLRSFMASVYQSMGHARYNLGNYTVALEDVNKSIPLISVAHREAFDSENIYNSRGLIYLALNRPKEALKDFETALAVNQELAYIYVNRAIALASVSQNVTMRKVNMGLTYSAPGNFSNSVWSFPMDIKIKNADGNLQLALNDCATAIRLDPDYPYAYYISAQLKYYLSKPDYCMDMHKAKSLGMPETDAFITAYCK